MLAPTPDHLLCDSEGRPYFLWDEDLTLDAFRRRLRDPTRRHYWLATLLRQAKPDDALRLVSLAEIDEAWPAIERMVGRQRDFWSWRLARWARDGKPA